MKNTKKTIPSTKILRWLDDLALAATLLFVYSVISNARTLIQSNIKDAPSSILLLLAIISLTYAYAKRKYFSRLNLLTVGMILTSVAIWLFGLSAHALH